MNILKPTSKLGHQQHAAAQSSDTDASRENLRQFRYHTGAEPRRVELHEPCPVLFRDIGPEAMQRFLIGDLKRLCGPLSPVTYLRTAQYSEPYEDYGKFGRIMVLSPKVLGPWSSGIDHVYITSGKTLIDLNSMVFIPDEIGLTLAAEKFSQARQLDEFVELIGPNLYRDAQRETLCQLQLLLETQRACERTLAPLRKLYQSTDSSEREKVIQWMELHSVTERELCSAWHHLPVECRQRLSSLAEQAAKEYAQC